MAALLGMMIALTLPAQNRPVNGSPEAQAPTRRNIILITVDSLRIDRLDPYTGKSELTPAIGELAARGVIFTRAYTASPSTAAATASILTGLYPIRHGLRDDLGGHLEEAVVPIARQLQAAGMHTGAVAGSVKVDSDRGLDSGFDSYRNVIEGIVKLGVGRSYERRADRVLEIATEFLDAAPAGRPFFLWLNFYDPHYDHAPPRHLQERFGEESYEGEVAHVDAQIAALMRTLQARDLVGRTDLLLAGSHGEGLGDHGEIGHGSYLFETTIRVPLVIALAGDRGREGATIERPVSLVDLGPTVLELAGLEVPAGLDGESLLPVLRSGTKGDCAVSSDRDRRLFVEAAEPHAAYGWSPLYAVIEGNRKIVKGVRLEAYDLDAAEGDGKALAEAPAWAEELEGFGAPLLGELQPPEARKEEIMKKALSLGLSWDNSPICLEKQGWPDPRDPERLAINGDLFRARIDSDQGIIGRGAISAMKILEREPVNFSALRIVLNLNLRRRNPGLLLDTLELFQCNYPYRGEPYHYYAHYLEIVERYDEAEKILRMYGWLEPWNEEMDYDLAAIHAVLGNKEKAYEHLERAISMGATNYPLMWQDGRLKSLLQDERFRRLVPPPEAKPPRY
jgi:arylsulfatase A-like enzyme